MENQIENIIIKIFQEKENEDIEEVIVDLKRITDRNFGKGFRDKCYIVYLYTYYANEINYINSSRTLTSENKTTEVISDIINIRNYLIKIAILRICKKKSIDLVINQIDNIDYCLDILK